MSITLDRRCQRATAAVVAIAGLVLLAAAPARAQSETSALCTVTFPAVSITPPFMPLVLTPASGTVTSGGQTGSVSCVGEVDGDRVTGAGARHRGRATRRDVAIGARFARKSTPTHNTEEDR